MNTQSNIVNASVLKYLVRQPQIQTAKPPVLILLHGVGSNEQDLFSFADQLPAKYLVVSARAPITLAEGSYAWYQVDFSTGKPLINSEQEEKSRNIIIQFITDLKKDFSFDEKQVYLGGFSQGAIMAYSVGLTRPDLIHGIVVLSGRLLEEVKPLIASKEKLGQLKVFISHGTNDQMLGIHYARESATYLKALNINTSYKEYAEGHGINNAMLSDMVNWLNSN
ncbi:MAG: esterase [Bacteroidota bacterium]